MLDYMVNVNGIDLHIVELDVLGLCLLSPGLVLFLYGVHHVSDRIGLTAWLIALVLLAAFIRVWRPAKGTVRS